MFPGNADMSTLDGPAKSHHRDAGGGDPVPVLTILGHPHLRRVGDRAALFPLTSGGSVALSRVEPAFVAPCATSGEPLGDAHLSRNPLRILRLGDGRVRLDKRDTPMRVVVDGAALEGSRDYAGTSLRAGLIIELADRVVLLLHEREPTLGLAPDRDSASGPADAQLGLIGESAAMARVRHEILRLTDLDVTVLVMGETGSGKELVARAIHRSGPRRERPFVAVNMGAIPPSLAGAELFGSEPGAFTGAVKSTGHFRSAQDGTLFLDEVGETPFDVQAMLLRALDVGEVQALGSSRPQQVRARVIAATDADLEERVRSGAFRAPLLHRLASYRLLVPSLRERKDDIGRLIVHYLRMELGRMGDVSRLDDMGVDGKPYVPADVFASLCRYDWPGNVRQLRNVVRQLVLGTLNGQALESGEALSRLLSPSAITAPRARAQQAPEDSDPTPPPSRAEWRKPGEVGEAELLQTLRDCRWDLKSTAERLRISRTSLYAIVETCTKVRRLHDIAADEIARCHQECNGDVERMVDQLEVSRHALQRRLRELKLSAS